MHETAFVRVRRGILQAHPDNPHKYENCLSEVILQRLSTFFSAIVPLPQSDVSAECNKCIADTECLQNALVALRPALRRKEVSRICAADSRLAVEPIVFQKLGFEPPGNSKEILAVAAGIVKNLRRNLEVLRATQAVYIMLTDTP